MWFGCSCAANFLCLLERVLVLLKCANDCCVNVCIVGSTSQIFRSCASLWPGEGDRVDCSSSGKSTNCWRWPEKGRNLPFLKMWYSEIFNMHWNTGMSIFCTRSELKINSKKSKQVQQSTKSVQWVRYQQSYMGRNCETGEFWAWERCDRLFDLFHPCSFHCIVSWLPCQLLCCLELIYGCTFIVMWTMMSVCRRQMKSVWKWKTDLQRWNCSMRACRSS